MSWLIHLGNAGLLSVKGSDNMGSSIGTGKPQPVLSALLCFERRQRVGVEVEVVNWRECMKGASQFASTLPERPWPCGNLGRKQAVANSTPGLSGQSTVWWHPLAEARAGQAGRLAAGSS